MGVLHRVGRSLSRSTSSRRRQPATASPPPSCNSHLDIRGPNSLFAISCPVRNGPTTGTIYSCRVAPNRCQLCPLSTLSCSTEPRSTVSARGSVGRAWLTPWVTHHARTHFFFFFFTLVTGPRRSLRLKLSDTIVYEPQIRARLGTTAQCDGC